ncbi:unnamed protein product [Protopolystoma xenopodis]|uniref:Band 7 domain-containing protein n=1 Tax=Protopolystoma xenopodis TaxID=117903 RepID=A0A3S5CR49_9PLAT|nr:unnamed protein product [Protopolystoma xenopodis]
MIEILSSVMLISRRFLITKNNLFTYIARYSSSTPFNTGILFVPHQHAWIVERFGKFNRVLEPGLNFCVPIIDRISYVQVLKELAIDIPDQSAITADNVVLQLNGILFLRVKDPYLASYGVEDAEFAITQVNTMVFLSSLFYSGKISLIS